MTSARKKGMVASLIGLGIILILVAIGASSRHAWAIPFSGNSELHLRFIPTGMIIYHVNDSTGRYMPVLRGVDGGGRLSTGPQEMMDFHRVPFIFDYFHSAMPVLGGRVAFQGVALFYFLWALIALAMPLMELAKFLFRLLRQWRLAVVRRRHELAQLRGGETCPGCGYDLRMTSDRCPECGVEFLRKTVIVAR
jgi:hypothetical protein